MQLLASSALNRLEAVPPHAWLNIGGVILVVLLTVALVRRVAEMNRLVLTLLVSMVGSMFFFQWIYNRNEPAFLTSTINRLAPFFPGKNDYNRKQGIPTQHS
ncbi:MAG TPA: hypothetical protein VKC60_05385 [Opitutaceae bacterium]|nr:hypothetical protein [Opitutaceae bacterium]